MGSTKHERSFVNYDKGYETNIIGVRGIVYFGVGLFLLIVVTFGLMLFMQNVMEDQAQERDNQNPNPMLRSMSKEERLPPEPRLQAAPGFGVGEGRERVNLELKAPQSEYWELEKQWNRLEREGQKDPNSGTVISLPIEEAKQRLLQENVKARSGPDAQKTFEESRMMVSYPSAGRMITDRRR